MKVCSKTVDYVSELLLLTSMIGCGGGSSEINEQVKDESTSTPAVEQLNIVEEKEDSAASATEGNSWVLRGQVLDQLGRPVADVDITTVWTANGVKLEELKRFLKEGVDDAKLAVNEGRMEPWGLHPTKTDAHGRFSMTMESRDYKLLAIDKERKRGALIVLTGRKTPSSVKVKLVPLVRLHGRVRIAATGQELKDVTVCVRLPLNEKFPLGADRFAMCSSLKSRFEFWLPPGDYQLEAFSHITPPIGHVGLRSTRCG